MNATRTGSIGQHVARRPVIDALVGALEQADDEARERLSEWLGEAPGRVLSWPEVKAEIERLTALERTRRAELAEQARRADRAAFDRRAAGAAAGATLVRSFAADGGELE